MHYYTGREKGRRNGINGRSSREERAREREVKAEYMVRVRLIDGDRNEQIKHFQNFGYFSKAFLYVCSHFLRVASPYIFFKTRGQDIRVDV